MYNAVTNNLCPLPFYVFEGLWDCQKWYSNGNILPIQCEGNLIPFFFDIGAGSTIKAIRIFQLCNKSGIDISASDFKEVEPPMATEALRYDSWLEAFKDNGLTTTDGLVVYTPGVRAMLDDGIYYISVDDGGVLFKYNSELFQVNSHLDSRKFIKIEWSNKEDLACQGVAIPYSKGYKNSLIVEATIARPEYVYEEEGEERMGFFYPSKQVSYKKYKFNFLAPEYLCDCIRLIPLSDSLKISSGYNFYPPTLFNVDFDWIEGGQFANVECEFTTNTIAKRVASSYITENLGNFNDSFNK